MAKKTLSPQDFDGPVRRLRSGSYRDVLDVDQFVDTSGSQQGGKLKPFWDAMENRNITGEPVDILIIGDSIMTNETAALSANQRVIEVFQQQLTSKFGNGYGIYYQARGAGGLYGFPWTIVGYTAPAVGTGIGQNAMLIDADADLATLTTVAACDRVTIAYRADGANAGVMRITIDGGANIDVTTTGAADTLWDSGSLTAGVHTVVVKRVPTTGGSFILEGAMVECGCRNPGGVRMWDGAHSGIGAVEFGANTVWTQAIGPTKVVNPDLIVMSLGENDVGDGEPAFATGIDQVISALLTVAPKTTCAYVMHTPWGFANQLTDTIAPINADIRTRCTTNGFVLADMHAWLKHFLSTDDGFTFDAVHPWGQGVQMIVRSFMYSLGLAKSPPTINMRYDIGGVPFPFFYPEGTIKFLITAQGGGGGGGAGRRGAAGAIRCGGGGGAGGSRVECQIDAGTVPNDGTYYINIGAIGVGAVPTTVNDTNGAVGGNAGHTWFASDNNIQLSGIYAPGGGGGGGGTASAGAAGVGSGGLFRGNDGAAAVAAGTAGVTPTVLSQSFGGGGGSGGGITAANVYSNGGNGGQPGCGISSFLTAFGVLGGVSGGALPGIGKDINGWCATGGAGGASHASTPQAGGNGATGGGGGGGGGASLNGFAAPKGGDGGVGYFNIVCLRHGDVV